MHLQYLKKYYPEVINILISQVDCAHHLHHLAKDLSNGELFSMKFVSADFILDLAICEAVKLPTEASFEIISFLLFVSSRPLISSVDPSTTAW